MELDPYLLELDHCAGELGAERFDLTQIAALPQSMADLPVRIAKDKTLLRGALQPNYGASAIFHHSTDFFCGGRGRCLIGINAHELKCSLYFIQICAGEGQWNVLLIGPATQAAWMLRDGG